MKALILGFLSSISVAHADVLFVDVNDNPKEIESARKAAAERKEALIVYPPPVSADAKKKIDAIRTRLDGVPWSSAEGRRLRNEIMGLKNEITGSKVKEKLAELAASKTKLSAIIISGHDGNGHFTGSNGSLTAEKLHEGLKENAEMASGVRALYLWGCYTTTYGSCEAHWKKDMPNLSTVIGFDGSAPAQDKEANHTYLMDAMEYEKQFTAARDDKQIRALWGKIRNIGQVQASMCMDERIVTNGAIRSRAEMDAVCESVLKEKSPQRWSERVRCYRDGAPGCENVPQDTANGELRKIYVEMQAASHCRQVFENSDDPAVKSMGTCWPDVDEVIRLVLNRQVLKNFMKNHAHDVAHVDEQLEKFDMPPELKLGDVTKLSRTEINAKLAGVQANILQRQSSRLHYLAKSAPEIHELADRVQSFSQTLTRPAEGCVPFNWVEPIPTQGSPCIKPPNREQTMSALKKAYQSVIAREVKLPDDLQAERERLKQESRGMHRLADEDPAAYREKVESLGIVRQALKEKAEPHFKAALDAELDQFRDSNPDHMESPLYRLYRGPGADSNLGSQHKVKQSGGGN